MARSRDELMEVRKQMLTQMEQKLHELWSSEEDSLFYYHPSEVRVVLSQVYERNRADKNSCPMKRTAVF